MDLHVHTTASDGRLSPADLVQRARSAGLDVLAITDHDTLAGVVAARDAGEAVGLRVIAGCEFSVQVPGGEMHLLGYFLPTDDEPLLAFLEAQRGHRVVRAREMVRRLKQSGVDIEEQDVIEVANGGAIGRPHVARVLVAKGVVEDIDQAFHRYLGWRRPAFVPKKLPALVQVTDLVRQAGGVTSAAHLKERASRGFLERLQKAGLDGVEVVHPAHDPDTENRLDSLALELGLLRTGGSDWHGSENDEERGMGRELVPHAWLEALEHRHLQRLEVLEGRR